MKTRLFQSALLSICIVAVLTSCNNNTTDSTPQYMRGGNSLIMDNGNLIIAGYNSSSTKGYQATLVSVNPSNADPSKVDTNWTKTYGNLYSDAFFNVIKARGGGFVATGFSNRANGGAPSMLVVITDAAGKELHSVSSYGGSAYTEGFSVVQNADSGYLVAGFIQKTSTSDRNLYLARIKDNGSLYWDKSIGATSSNSSDTVNDAAYCVIAAPGSAGGYYITGSINGGVNMEGAKIFLMKVSANGDSLWTKTYGSGFGYSLALTQDGGIAISGSILNGTSQDVFLLKTDLDGNRLWPGTGIKTFGGSAFEYGASMIQTSSGGFAITGITESITNGLQDVYLILTDPSGVAAVPIGFHYGGTDNEQGYGIVQSGTDFHITGLSNTGGSYIYINKVDANGAQLSGWPMNIP
jgi:hypothetical protein